jgi:signal peptidase I
LLLDALEPAFDVIAVRDKQLELQRLEVVVRNTRAGKAVQHHEQRVDLAQIPEDSYFVMGDHCDSLNDSRVFGPVSRQNIYGKAVFAYWPVDHFGSLTLPSTVEASR